MRFYIGLLFALSAAAVLAQTPPAFEVATVRPTAGPIPGIPAMFGQQQTTRGSNNISAAGGVITGRNVTMSRLAGLLSSVMRRPVLDATGLEGTYNFLLDPKPYAAGGGPLDLPSLIITAIAEELGLRLESRKFEMQVLVIDHVERPDPN